MSETKEQKQKIQHRIKAKLTTHKFGQKCLIAILSLFVFGLFCGVGYYFFLAYYQQKFFPGLHIQGEDVSGKSYLEALNSAEQFSNQLSADGLKFVYQKDELQVEPITISLTDPESPEVISEVLSFDNEYAVKAAYAYGRTGTLWQNFLAQAKALILQDNFNLNYQLNTEELTRLLQAHYSKYATPAEDAQLTFINHELTVTEEKIGQNFNYPEIIEQVQINLTARENPQVVLSLQQEEPRLKKTNTGSLVKAAERVLAALPLTLTYNDKSYTVERVEFEKWIKFKDNVLTLDEEAVTTYLNGVSEEINVPVKEGKFSLDQKDGALVLTQFQQSQDGLEINVPETINAIQQDFLQNQKKTVALVVSTAKPKFTPDNIYGEIKALLGTGQTNMAGSPYNRRLNIAKGADILNGLLIAPGETFSLIETLGEIDAANGWYPELVIKGNKTTPEYGGGLCQVGTTVFRTAMMTGLPIVERANHSYAVSYYFYKGKAGVDATIYDPKPDMRFTNDTGHYLLWRTRIEGDNIYFELWGTSDGRKGYFTDPINYDYRSPGPTQYTDTTDLDPGVEKCSERAHTGLSADFDYLIDWPDGHQDKETFHSVYKPWPAVCLRGVVDNPDVTDDADATDNTNTNTNSNTNAAN